MLFVSRCRIPLAIGGGPRASWLRRRIVAVVVVVYSTARTCLLQSYLWLAAVLKLLRLQFLQLLIGVADTTSEQSPLLHAVTVAPAGTVRSRH
jgi:hypothetical protein